MLLVAGAVSLLIAALHPTCTQYPSTGLLDNVLLVGMAWLFSPLLMIFGGLALMTDGQMGHAPPVVAVMTVLGLVAAWRAHKRGVIDLAVWQLFRRLGWTVFFSLLAAAATVGFCYSLSA